MEEADLHIVPQNTDPYGHVPDCVCPHCFHPLSWPSMVTRGPEHCGRMLRTYYGWCFACQKGGEVIQFAKQGRWIIHKYQSYTLDENLHTRPSGQWVELNALPEPPLIMTGPGGDYARPLSDAQCKDILESSQWVAGLWKLIEKFRQDVNEYCRIMADALRGR